MAEPARGGRCSDTQRQLMGQCSTPLGYYNPQPEDVPLRELYLKHFGVEQHRA